MAKLVANVHVDGAGWFGPDYGNADDVPPEVAERITNPAVWEDGKPPAARAKRTTSSRKTAKVESGGAAGSDEG